MKPLCFEHHFKSGRVGRLVVERQPNTKPTVTTNVDSKQLTPEELEEYIPWRNNIAAESMSALTPGEVFAVAEHGRSVLRR